MLLKLWPIEFRLLGKRLRTIFDHMSNLCSSSIVQPEIQFLNERTDYIEGPFNLVCLQPFLLEFIVACA